MIKDIIIGLITGVISSTIVSLFFQKWLEKRDWRKQVEADKQELCNYIKKLLVELLIYEKNLNSDNLLRLIEREPRRTTFLYLDKDDETFLSDFRTLQADITKFCIEHDSQNKLEIEEEQQLCNWQCELNSYTNRALMVNPYMQNPCCGAEAYCLRKRQSVGSRRR